MIHYRRFGTKLYAAWTDMRTRCSNKNCHTWIYYGGQGITICKEWEDYAVFRTWSLANGFTKHLSLDRRDNDGNYEPSNCRWVTKELQNQNRSMVKLSPDNVRLIRQDTRSQYIIAREYGISQPLVSGIKQHKYWRNIV